MKRISGRRRSDEPTRGLEQVVKIRNVQAGILACVTHPNIGFEQAFSDRRVVVRFGVDETSPTAGFSGKLGPVNLDFAYAHDMARARVGELFGAHSRSFVMTLTLDYAALFGGH